MAYHSLQNKAPSPDYDKGHAATFGAKVDRHCQKCGRLPAWCECATVRMEDGTQRKVGPHEIVTYKETIPVIESGDCRQGDTIFSAGSGPGVGRIGVNANGRKVRLP